MFVQWSEGIKRVTELHCYVHGHLGMQSEVKQSVRWKYEREDDKQHEEMVTYQHAPHS